MRLTSFLENGCLTVVLTGEIDHHCAKGYIAAIGAKLDVYKPKECILDFGQVTFMDSSGIAVVINALRSMTKLQGKLSVSDLKPQPLRVFCASGIDKLVEQKEHTNEV